MKFWIRVDIIKTNQNLITVDHTLLIKNQWKLTANKK